MAVRQVQASGPEYLALVTRLLQRARLAHPEAGQWRPPTSSGGGGCLAPRTTSVSSSHGHRRTGRDDMDARRGPPGPGRAGGRIRAQRPRRRRGAAPPDAAAERRDVALRLRQCSLYDPALDLAVETAEGDVAGYALFWFDPVTEVGLVEPLRVEDAYQRRGIARALVTEGLARLAERGARRLKVGYVTEAARALCIGAGFRVAATSTTYSRG